MKQAVFYVLILVFGLGCATYEVAPRSVQTVNSDMVPAAMTRDQYYEELARAYSNDRQSQSAIDNFRISLLHNPLRISAHLGLADEYKKIELNHLASFELGEVLKIDPKNSDALMRLGDLYLAAQIYTKAKSTFAEVLKLNAKSEQARWALFYLAKFEKNDIEAENLLNQIATNENNQIKLLLEKAFLNRRMGNLEKYTQLVKEAYNLQPRNKSVVMEMKNEYLKNADYDSAQAILVQFTEAHDFDLEVSQALTDVSVNTENYEIALRELSKQENWVKDPILVELKKAHVYFLAGRMRDAEIKYNEVLEIKPNLDEAEFYLAQVYLAQKQNQAALPLLSGLSPASVFFADAQVTLAFFEVKNDQDQAALNRLDQAQERRPDQLPIYKAYSDLLLDMHKYEQAAQILEMGIAFFPNEEDLRINAALASYRQGDEAGFKNNIDEALRINPENSEIYAALAEIWYQKRSDPKELESFVTKALSYKSKNRNMKPLLAWALMAQDRSMGSVSLFEKFYEDNPKQPFFAEALSKVYRSADVTIKAQQMTDQALQLQNQQSLKTGLSLPKSRVPASTK